MGQNFITVITSVLIKIYCIAIYMTVKILESRTVIVIKEILNVNEFGIIPMILLFIISYQLPFLSG